MSVSFLTKCFFFVTDLSRLVLEIFRFFENNAQNLNAPPPPKKNNYASWDLQMRFNSAFKGLIAIFFLLFFVGVTSFLSVTKEHLIRLFQANGPSRIFGLIPGVRLR
jgi:hypothetical protein